MLEFGSLIFALCYDINCSCDRDLSVVVIVSTYPRFSSVVCCGCLECCCQMCYLDAVCFVLISLHKGRCSISVNI